MKILREQQKAKEAAEKAAKQAQLDQNAAEEADRLRKMQDESERAMKQMALNNKAVIGGRSAFTERESNLR
jgi:hypothetical protein